MGNKVISKLLNFPITSSTLNKKDIDDTHERCDEKFSGLARANE